jgi:hypothetical protein
MTSTRRRAWGRRAAALTGATAVAVGALALPADAAGRPPQNGPDSTFAHTGSFFVTDNLAPGEPLSTLTSAEIADTTADGDTLVYTDAFTRRLGFVDISDPADPIPLGAVDLPGDPTSVAVHDGYALVAVNTSPDFVNPSGDLLVLDLATRAIVRTIPLAGQPDAVSVAPSGRYAAIAIENERDEDLDDGIIPQLPPGSLQVVDLAGPVARWSIRTVDLTGLADVAPSDPEPEYVDINQRNQAVVTMQENNHLVVVDLRTASVINDFSAGAVDIDGIDTVEEELGPQENGLIELTGSLTARRREPDAVQWVDQDTFATANEGDYEDATGVEGGTRTFTLFNVDGTVEFDSGNSYEHEIVRAGHYPEFRSENKGSEPEGIEVGHWKGRTLIFVGAERANAVEVWDASRGEPQFLQLLPSGIGPEGIEFTSDGTLVVTAEVDGLEDGFSVRPIITTFTLGEPTYPQIVSDDEASSLPIPWVALSGLSGEPTDPNTLWAVSDSFLAQAWLYEVDVSSTPARIVQHIPVGGVDVADQLLGDYDLEGVAARPDGGFWLASEGRVNVGSSRPNLLVRIDDSGTVQQSVELPAALVANATSSGFEGVTVTEEDGQEVLYAVIQREWADDAAGFVKVGRYEVATDTWTFASYPLDAVESPAGGWVGLSEVTALPDGRLAIVERDNQLGQEARIKRIYAVDPASVSFAPYGGALPTLDKVLLRDVYADLDAASISVPDKVEGMAVAADGQVYLVTDNDGVDENYGETVFLGLGSLGEAFGP